MAKFGTNRDHYYDLVPVEIINSALAIDAQDLAENSDIKEFIAKNKTEYTIAINTWISIVAENSKHTVRYFIDRIYKGGLAALIKACDDASSVFIQNWDDLDVQKFPDHLFWVLWQDCLQSESTWPIAQAIRGEYPNADLKYLTILRYLKRLSPIRATKLDSAAIEDFVENQKFLKVRDRGTVADDNRLVLSLVRDEIAKLPIKKRINAFSRIDIHDIEITHGAAFDSQPMLLTKLGAIERVCPGFFENTEHFVSAFEPIYMGRTLPKVKLRAVPKNYKKARTIAMENTYRQAVAKRMFTIWQETLPGSIDLHDQSKNQRLAEQGSIDGSYATIDLSAASDFVRYTLVKSLYPDEFTQYLDLVRPVICVLPNNKEISLSSWGTMGNSLTFILESEIFYAICKAAVSFHERHFGKCRQHTISVYGDDMVVPDEACPTVIAFLEALGFRVNHDKTFYGEIPYRESCGKEYYNGIDWTTVYFPRFPISNAPLDVVHDGRDDTWQTNFSRLLSLQHRLSSISEEAACWLAYYLLDIEPKIAVADVTVPNAIWGADHHFSKETFLKKYDAIEFSYFDIYQYITVRGLVEMEEDTQPSPTEQLARLRQYCYYPVASYPEVRSPLMEKYLYLQFLHHGPSYADDWMRILGISTPVRRIDTLHPYYEWKYTVV